jgi:HAE1 family hydrophobic/amphiphilic exporter-1
MGALMRRKEIAIAYTTFSTGNPQYLLNIDDARAKQLGISISDLLQTLQMYYGSSFVSDFQSFWKILSCHCPGGHSISCKFRNIE